MVRFYVQVDSDSNQKHKLNEGDRARIATWLCEAGHTCTFSQGYTFPSVVELPVYTLYLAYVPYSSGSIVITSYRARVLLNFDDDHETWSAWTRPLEEIPVSAACIHPFSCFTTCDYEEIDDLYMPPPPPHPPSLNWYEKNTDGNVVVEGILVHPVKGNTKCIAEYKDWEKE